VKIYDEAMDQCLLCIDFDFDQDSPLNREIARRTFGRGAREKEWWRYDNAYLGLKVFTAYIGPKPVGHIEVIPIEHAPRPIDGDGYLVITCLHVPGKYQEKGIGKALLNRAEEYAASLFRGVALITQDVGAFMPTAFFLGQGYRQADYRKGERLLFKAGMTFDDPPTLLPISHQGRKGEGRLAVDFIHCPQCARSGRVLECLRDLQHRRPSALDLRVIQVAKRDEIRELGLAYGLFIEGEQFGGFPPDAAAVNAALERTLTGPILAS
jgi:GNAT superfamily N-acetyltransferase